MTRLDHWSIVDRQPSDFLALPERAVWCLRGRVHDHPRLPDGHEIMTTRIAAVRERTVMTESGSVYLLGEVDPEWAKAAGDVMQRLNTAGDVSASREIP